jgi:hypothetical protein
MEKSLQAFEIAQNGDGNLPASRRVRILEGRREGSPFG